MRANTCADGVTRKFGDFVAVNNVSLKINQGEIFCLLGGSGCGKTTLLRMLAGFETPTTGAHLIDGQDMAGIPPYERPVNMMFQSYALFPHMTVEKNVAFGLEQEKLPRRDRRARRGDARHRQAGPSSRKRKPHQLSGGQRQRVALARSLVKRPKLLLLDEPLGALDKKLREHTQFELINIQERLGVTFIVVTHDQEEAMTLATAHRRDEPRRDRAGRHAAGDLRVPVLAFVADFIGSVNMFEGRLIEDEPDHVRIQSDELGGACLRGSRHQRRAGATVWVAIRPEKINIGRERPAGEDNLRARRREGDRLHGRHVHLPGADRQRAHDARDPARTSSASPKTASAGTRPCTGCPGIRRAPSCLTQ
jgi:putrescine transport system ATP-binding protein